MPKYVETSIAYFLEEIMMSAVGIERSDLIFIVQNEENANRWNLPLGTVGYDNQGIGIALGKGSITQFGSISFPLDDFIEWTDVFIKKIAQFDDEIETGFTMGIVCTPSTDGWFDYPVGTIFLAGYRDSMPIGQVDIVDEIK